MKISSYSDLEKFINNKLSDALQSGVKDDVQKLLKENIKSVVYDAYEPKAYNRKGLMYQSDDYEMIDDNTLKVTHARMDSGSWGSRDVSKVVEYGKGYIWRPPHPHFTLDTVIGPRPFMGTTKEDLESGEFKKILKNNLSKQGLNLK